MTTTPTSNGWRLSCDWLIGCTRESVIQDLSLDVARARASERGWTTGKRDTDYCPEHSGGARAASK